MFIDVQFNLLHSLLAIMVALVYMCIILDLVTWQRLEGGGGRSEMKAQNGVRRAKIFKFRTSKMPYGIEFGEDLTEFWFCTYKNYFIQCV